VIQPGGQGFPQMPRFLAQSLTAAAFLSIGCIGARVDPYASQRLPNRVAFKTPVDQYALSNGLEVLLAPDHRTPLVAVNVLYRVGARDDPPGQGGLAHLFEHLMFRGSRHVPDGKYAEYLEQAGALEVNGGTTPDWTLYWELVPSSALATALWLESDRLGYLPEKVPAPILEHERRVVAREREQRYDNATYGRVEELVHAAVYPAAHPYAHPPIGTAANLGAITADALGRFGREFYRPNRASLVLAGDFDPAEARALIDRYFGPIPPGSADPHAPPAITELHQVTVLRVECGAPLGALGLAWPTPPTVTLADADLDVMAMWLEDHLSWVLVSRGHLAQDVSVHQQSGDLGGLFEIWATAAPGVRPETLLATIDAEIARRAQNELDDHTVYWATNHLLKRLYLGNDDLVVRGQSMAESVRIAGSGAYLELASRRYQTVRPWSLEQAVSQFLPLDRRIVAYVEPVPGAPLAGRLKGSP
jgi:zinc protease